jgi:hypothetical protein
MIEWIEAYWNALIMMVAEMAPYLLLGFFVAGILHTFVPRSIYSRHLAPRNMKSVVKAALLGIPLPLCSCGVIPTSVSLRKEGASHGACTSFLIATPQTGVDSIAATYSLMGLPFAIVRPIAALFTAMFGGWLVNRYAKEDEQISAEAAKKGEYESLTPNPSPKGEGSCHSDEDNCECGCGCEHEHHYHSLKDKFVGALRYGFVDMFQDVGKWLVIGLLIAALITVAVPNEWLAALHEYKLLNMLIVLAVAIPMYVCATGSIPIAVSLMAKGLTPGAALVLLMAGPAVNSASILVIGKAFGRRTLRFYITSIVIGAIAFGLCIDYLLPQEWFAVSGSFTEAAHCGHCLSVWNWIFIAVFLLLLVNAFTARFRHSHHLSHEHEHEHHHHEEEQTVAIPSTMVYAVKGMSCNHCKASVEKAISGVEGVEKVEVDLTKGIAYVEGKHDTQAVLDAVNAIGFNISVSENQ